MSNRQSSTAPNDLPRQTQEGAPSSLRRNSPVPGAAMAPRPDEYEAQLGIVAREAKRLREMLQRKRARPSTSAVEGGVNGSGGDAAAQSKRQSTRTSSERERGKLEEVKRELDGLQQLLSPGGGSPVPRQRASTPARSASGTSSLDRKSTPGGALACSASPLSLSQYSAPASVGPDRSGNPHNKGESSGDQAAQSAPTGPDWMVGGREAWEGGH
jgi:hypothetical protein